MQPTTRVLYDVTRLIQRRRARIPTGIDRIDAQWALAAFEAFGERCLPVMMHGKGARILHEEQALVRSMLAAQINSWFGDGTPDEEVARALDRAGLSANAGYGSRVVERALFARRSWQDRFVTAYLPALRYGVQSFLSNWRRSNERALEGCEQLLYVNASHQGLIGHAGALDGLAGARAMRAAGYIHDLIPIEFPEYATDRSLVYLEAMLAELMAKDTDFSANSQATARQLSLYLAHKRAEAGVEGGNAEPVVVYPGLTGAAPLKDVSLQGAAGGEVVEGEWPGGDFVILGTLEPRKNHQLLLHLWRQLAEEGFSPMPRLTIVGRRGWGNGSVTALLDHSPMLKPFVRELGNLDDQDMFTLIGKARALLFPSFTEGFGLPLMEAAELGVPVIASDLDVFHEIVDDGVLFLDPLDGPAWKAAIKDAVHMPKRLAVPVLNGRIGDWSVQREAFAACLKGSIERLEGGQ